MKILRVWPSGLLKDKSTASTGGKLNKFNSGELSSVVFEDQAFAIKHQGEYSAPFQSEYGWHIVKLIKSILLNHTRILKQSSRGRIKRDDRSKLITASMSEKLRNRYDVSVNKKTYEQVFKSA